MPRNFGAATFPFAVPEDGEAITDPGLDVLAEAFAAIFRGNVEAAWAAVSAEPLIRAVHTHEPGKDLLEKDLPALYVYRDDERRPRRETLGDLSFQSTIFVRYVLPPTTTGVAKARLSPIFNAFKCLERLTYEDRDPAWIHEDETGDPDTAPDARTKVLWQAAQAYGSSIQQHAGIDFWELQDTSRSVLRLNKNAVYETVDMRLLVVESGRDQILTGTSPDALADQAANGVAMAQVDITITTGGDDPLVTQHTREPDLP